MMIYWPTSFTADLWSSEVSLVTLTSPTMDWLSAECNAFKSGGLQVKQRRGSNTSKLLLTIIREILGG